MTRERDITGFIKQNNIMNDCNKINPDSSTLYCKNIMHKTLRGSWFKKFHFNSLLAEKLFEGQSIFPQQDGIIVLQFMFYGELIIAELISKEDFNKNYGIDFHS